jgi:hypothetical protein
LVTGGGGNACEPAVDFSPAPVADATELPSLRRSVSGFSGPNFALASRRPSNPRSSGSTVTERPTVKFVEWSMQGTEFANCSCDWGCSCQFNGPPTSGHCHAYTFVQIDRGRFGDVSLDGLRWGIRATWPAAIHLGNGTFQSIVDERADPGQRAALESISHGEQTDPGKLIWQVFSTTITKLLPTLYKPIDLSIDLNSRRARVRVPDVVEGAGESIRNPVTGADHQIRVTLPTGFEFTDAEFISGQGRGYGDLKLDFSGTHAHLARIHWGTHGVVR